MFCDIHEYEEDGKKGLAIYTKYDSFGSGEIQIRLCYERGRTY